MERKYCLTLEKEALPERSRRFLLWRVRESSYTLVRCPAGNVVFSEDINALEAIAHNYFCEHPTVSTLYARAYFGRFRIYDLEQHGRHRIGEVVRIFSVTDKRTKDL